MNCTAVIFSTQIILAFGIAYGFIPAGPPTLAAIMATLIFIHALFFTGILK